MTYTLWVGMKTGRVTVENSMEIPQKKKKKKRKESACNAGDPGLTPGLGGCPGEGNDNPLQYSCLENPMDRRT